MAARELAAQSGADELAAVEAELDLVGLIAETFNTSASAANTA